MNIHDTILFCHQCSLQFESSSVFGLHSKLLHKSNSLKRELETNNSFKVEAAFHMPEFRNQLSSVSKGNKTFKCPICDHVFSYKSHLKRHVTHLHERNKLIKCKFCKYSCFQESSLKMHVANVHEGKKQTMSNAH